MNDTTFFVNKNINDKEALLRTMKNSVGLELHCEDFEPVREFYTRIGFEILFDSPGNHLTLRLGLVIINFWIVDTNGFYIRFTEPHDWIFSFEGYLSSKDQ